MEYKDIKIESDPKENRLLTGPLTFAPDGRVLL
jgi:hypothetical protein